MIELLKDLQALDKLTVEQQSSIKQIVESTAYDTGNDDIDLCFDRIKNVFLGQVVKVAHNREWIFDEVELILSNIEQLHLHFSYPHFVTFIQSAMAEEAGDFVSGYLLKKMERGKEIRYTFDEYLREIHQDFLSDMEEKGDGQLCGNDVRILTNINESLDHIYDKGGFLSQDQLSSREDGNSQQE